MYPINQGIEEEEKEGGKNKTIRIQENKQLIMVKKTIVRRRQRDII